VGETTEELTTDELRRDIDNRRTAMSGTLEAIGDRVSPGRIIQRRRNRMIVWVGNARDRVMGTAHAVTSAPADTVDTVRGSTTGAPLVAGGIAFGLGMLVGTLIPTSRTERQLSQEAMRAVEPLKTELQEAGQEMVEQLKEPVSAAVDDVKETAQQAAHEVRQSADDAAAEMRETPAG
jgi:ElaB/YqjD/DUF883 family membrane-anchored ribosome-binding protein